MPVGTKNSVVAGCGLHHVAVYTRSLENSLRLYRDTLGMSIVAEFGAPARKVMLLDMGDGSHMELFQPTADSPKEGDPAANDPVNHFALATTDTEATVEHVRAAGYRITVEPRRVFLDGIEAIIAFFQGPSGESVELFETVADRRN